MGTLVCAYSRTIRVFYPIKKGKIVLRTEKDWNLDIKPDEVDKKKHCYNFNLTHNHFLLSFKIFIKDGENLTEAVTGNKFALMNQKIPYDIYPGFFCGTEGAITDIIELYSYVFKKYRQMRIYLPPGYEENMLKHYPVLYMQDGKNLFFPEESFLGKEWMVNENMNMLNSMNLIEKIIIVGIYAQERDYEYTKPGYKKYGTSLIKEIKPWIDEHFRTLKGPWHTYVMGSSFGGVVSFYLAWEYPHIFGAAACMSSTFSWKDNLVERVEKDSFEQRKNLKIYLDSGWPGDNYEANQRMAYTLLGKGFRLGRDFIYSVFPLAKHDEIAWGERLHIPLQIFSGNLRWANVEKFIPEAMEQD